MSTNISKQKRDALLDKINQIKNYISAAPQDENTANLLAYIGELTKEINGKKYGLVFEEHREKIDELLEENAPVLVEQEDLFIDNGGEMNFLIEGDNLAALKLLEKTHKGKIDVIYIDPPYNRRKNDFRYDDNYVNLDDEFRHSKWLSFMSKRLGIAKKLITHDGYILMSIDDYEANQLKILCDEIFGENNFINQFVWQRNSSGKTEKDKYTVNTEYVLLYSRSNQYVLNNVYKPLAEATIKLYKKDDHDGRGKYRLYPLQKPQDPGPETTYDYIDNNGKLWKCPPKGWRIKESKLKELENDGRLCLENETLSEKAYWNERENEGKRIDTLWNDIAENTVGSSELEKIQGKPNTFDNPKPTELIKRCISIQKNKSSTILDFFAGSGTTGHAVMKLNAEDGGNRKFILCTNNENNICQDVTYQRLKTVITGKRKDGSDYDESYKSSLKYFKIDYLPIKDKMYYEYADELLEHVKELVELENAIDFNSNKSVAIVLDDDELDDFVENIADYPECKTLYMGHDVLTSYQQEQTIKAYGITINTVPDYYYRDLAN